MFCTNCGKNINNEMVCPFCGMTQELQDRQNQSVPFVNQQMPQQEFMQEQPNLYKKNFISENAKFGAVAEDEKFNIMALWFGFFWLIYHRMWQAVIINVILILFGIIPVFETFSYSIGILWNVFWGVRGNYYKRLQNEEKIGFINALQKRLY